MRNMTLECRYRSRSGGCLKSLNTVSPWWWPFKWDIRFVVKTWRLFSSFLNPCWTCIAHSNALSSSATEKNFQTGEDMFTNDEVMSATQAESHYNLKAAVTCTRKADESQINQTDWLIYQQAYFTSSRYRISFIYRSNKNDVIFTHIGR